MKINIANTIVIEFKIIPVMFLPFLCFTNPDIDKGNPTNDKTDGINIIPNAYATTSL